MKQRPSRSAEHLASGRGKPETIANGTGAVQRVSVAPPNNQPTPAQVIRKRRSSINVYDQPSSLNSRLRQLETDMLRLDEDRTKLYDDTHSSLAQFEIRLNEIQAILKSRQDNVEKYVEEMQQLLQARDEFEKQIKSLGERQDRIHEKLMHRETIISREIKLLKNKFELLEKNRQFRAILQRSNSSVRNGGSASAPGQDPLSQDDLTSGLDSTGQAAPGGSKYSIGGDKSDADQANGNNNVPASFRSNARRVGKVASAFVAPRHVSSVANKLLGGLTSLGGFAAKAVGICGGPRFGRKRRGNRVSSQATTLADEAPIELYNPSEPNDASYANNLMAVEEQPVD